MRRAVAAHDRSCTEGDLGRRVPLRNGAAGDLLSLVGCSHLAQQVLPRSAVWAALRSEMLRQLQSLRLVVRADALAVQCVGFRDHPLVDEATDDLAVLEDEGHLARADLENRART